METNSPASTNGVNLFMLGEARPTIAISLPSHAGLPSLSGRERYFDPVNAEIHSKTHLLTHPSATAAYAAYKADSVLQGWKPVEFRIWLVAAQQLIQEELNRLKEAKNIEPTGAIIQG